MNQDAAHSFRLHHTGVTDVINAKPRVDATRTLTGKGSQPHCCYLKRCSQTLRGACRARDIPVVIMHQDAFTADYQEEECRLIGWRYSSLASAGKEVRVHGRNRETVDQSPTTH